MTETEWPELMKVAEVAAILRVSKMTVYRLIHAGELECLPVGRSFRVRADSLRAYIEGPTEIPQFNLN